VRSHEPIAFLGKSVLGAAMELIRALIVLIDISGYTKFIRMHRLSLLHAERIISELLESVIDASEHPLILNKLQGDAALFYAPTDGAPEVTRDVVQQVQRFFSAFAERERLLVSECTLCACDACLKVSQLKLKIVVHAGEIALKKIRQFEEIAGEDVILAHRLLKNSIASGEYLLLTKFVHNSCGVLEGRTPEFRSEDCPGVGSVEVVVYFPPEARSEGIPGRSSLWRKLAMFARLEAYTLKRLFAPSRGTFANLEIPRRPPDS
jgi:hypothetical protein